MTTVELGQYHGTRRSAAAFTLFAGVLGAVLLASLNSPYSWC